MCRLAHILSPVGWVASATTDNPRDRKLVTLAGVLPDLDGLGLVVDIANGLIQGKATDFHYYQRYHHYLLHGWPGALLVTAVLTIFARQRTRTALISLLTYHLHLLCDLIGSRGPEAGDFWPIAYSEPFSRHPMWIWHGQWRLDGWQNQIIFAALFIFALWVSARKGFSFLEFFGRRVDSTFVNVMRRWFGAAGLLPVSPEK